jgi:hypothetical protein
VKRFLRENSLGLVFGLLFLIVLVGQAITGHADFNQQQLADNLPPVSFGRYITSASFGVDVLENWQSEYLQFFLYIFLTVWLLQKGSPESKKLDKPGRESERDQKIGAFADLSSPGWARTQGVKLWLFSNSLGLVMGLIFLLSWLGQSIAGRRPRPAIHRHFLVGPRGLPAVTGGAGALPVLGRQTLSGQLVQLDRLVGSSWCA